MRNFLFWACFSITTHCLLFFCFNRQSLPVIPFAAGSSSVFNIESYARPTERSGSTPISAIGTKTDQTSNDPTGGQIEDGSTLGIPPPDYPRLSRLRKEEGDVLLKIVLDPQLRLHSVEVVTSSGFLMLDQSARSRIEQSLSPAPPEQTRHEKLVRFKFRLRD